MRRWVRTSIACAVAAALWVGATDARAQGSRPDFAFGEEAAEATVLGVTAATNLMYLLPQRKSSWRPFRPRPYHALIARWSDMIGALGGSLLQLGTGYALEAAYLRDIGAEMPGIVAFHQSTIEMESLLLTSGITALIKRNAGRCRPRSFNAKEVVCTEFDAFPSGHTSAIAAFSGARIVRLAYTPTNQAFGWRALSLASSEVAMTITGVLRVLAGAHSWEDVLVGAVVGHVTGLTVALIHPNVEFGPPDDVGEPTGAKPARLSPTLFSWGGAF